MATDKGVIEGYTGVAAVDAKHQIIVDAHAHGTGSQQELLLPVIEALAALHVTALIADPEMRQRDERFADRAHHTTAPDRLHGKTGPAKTSWPLFAPSDFAYDSDVRPCVCPAGKFLYRKGARNVTNGNVGEHLRGARRDCAPCALRAQCLRTPETTVVRNVALFRGREPQGQGTRASSRTVPYDNARCSKHH